MKCSDNSPRFSSVSPMHQCLEFLITFLFDTTLCSPFPSNQLLAKKIAKQEFCGKLLTRALMDRQNPIKRFFFLFKHFVIASFMYTSNGDLNILKGFWFRHCYFQWQDLCSVNFDSLQRQVWIIERSEWKSEVCANMMCIVHTGITEKLGQNVCGVAFEVFYLLWRI